MTAARVLALGALLILVGCSASPNPPFSAPADLTAVVSDLQADGFACGAPEAGMPGPTLQWSCHADIQGQATTTMVTGTRQGLESIVVGVPATTPPTQAASIAKRVIATTTFLQPVRSQFEAWLAGWQGGAGGASVTWPSGRLGRIAAESNGQGWSIYLVVGPIEPQPSA